MKLTQGQAQQLSQQQLLGVRLLQMNSLELEHYIRELSQENPVIELNSAVSEAPLSQDDQMVNVLRWLEDNDRQNLYYQHMDSVELDPLARVSTAGGLDDTLAAFISCQLNRLHTPEKLARLTIYLVHCLDENGHLRFSIPELASSAGVSPKQLRDALSLLHTLEPAGIGAADLSHCLQLQRLEGSGVAKYREEMNIPNSSGRRVSPG